MVWSSGTTRRATLTPRTAIATSNRAFLRVNEDDVFGRESENEDEVFGSGWNGLLVVQDLDEETPSVAEQASEPITILQAMG
jgi:hypothetical protein